MARAGRDREQRIASSEHALQFGIGGGGLMGRYGRSLRRCQVLRYVLAKPVPFDAETDEVFYAR
jgi:hypothetical protein